MAGLIFILLSIVLTVTNSQCAKIIAGPSSNTYSIGSRFTLTCKTQARTETDSPLWKLRPHNSNEILLLSKDTVSKFPDRYTVESNSTTYNLIVKSATYQDDGEFECDIGDIESKKARIYIWDAPTKMELEWEGVSNGPDAVKADQQYNLICKSVNSHPPATHRFFKDGTVLDVSNIEYVFRNSSDSTTGYGNTTSTLAFTPTQEDINESKKISCVADLYDKKNASSVSFLVNSAGSITTTGVIMASLMSTILGLALYN